MKPTLVVLAAGMGSRYGGLKQIDPVGPNGEIILDYSIFDAIRGGFGKVVFIIRKDIEKDFKEVVSKRWEVKIELEYVYQQLDAIPAPYTVPEGRTKPWGTGHAVMCAADKVKEPFAVINADDFYGKSGFEQLGKALSETTDPNQFYMVGFPIKNTLSEFGSVSRGICELDENNNLKEVVERTKIEALGGGKAVFTDENGKQVELCGEEISSMNFWGFMPSLFNGMGKMFEDFLAERGTELKSEFYIPFVVAEMIHSGKATVKVLPSADAWFGVTYREDKPRVQADIRALIDAGVYPENLFA